MAAGRSVLRGALILSMAGIICKLLGAAYRIPLVRLIGDEGIGLYQMAYPLYLVFLALSTAGMPLAISKLVAERQAVGDGAGARRVLRLAMVALGSMGLLGGALMAGGAAYFARAVAVDSRAYPVILSLAPAVPLMSLMAALRGYFQGGQDMWPSGLSQLIEQIVRVATLLALAILLLNRGVQWAAAGAAFGAAAGGIAGLGLLIWWYYSHPWQGVQAAAGLTPGYGRIASRLIRLSTPIAIGALLLPLMQAVDSILVPTRLQAIGYAVGHATSAVGQLGNAWAIIYVPTTVTAAIAISLVPAVTESWVKREWAVAAARIESSLRTAILLCLPASAGLFFLAPEICRVLYGTSSAAELLTVLAPAAFFLGLQGVCAGALQGVGRTVAPVRNFALGFALKVGLTSVLCLLPRLGPRGAALGTVAGAALAALLNLADLGKRVELPGRIYWTLAQGAFATAAMAGVLWLAGRLPILANIGAFFRLAALLPLGILSFAAALWLVGGVQEGDVEVIRRLRRKPLPSPSAREA